MTVQLSTEDQATLESIVATGEYTSVDEALHVAVAELSRSRQEWIEYARKSIQEGLDDVAAGRLVDGDELMRELRLRVRKGA